MNRATSRSEILARQSQRINQAINPSINLSIIRRIQLFNKVQLYLLAYNILSFVTWVYLFLQVIGYLINQSVNHSINLSTNQPTKRILEPIDLYNAIKFPLYSIQSFAVLESIHALFGFVRASFFSAFLQQFGRSFILYGILIPVKESINQSGFVMMAFAWSTIEIVRYGFYITYQLAPNKTPDWLVWLRYSLFIPLYPLGVLGELLCLAHAIPILYRNEIWTLHMPNRMNFSFDWFYYVTFSSLLYLPGFPYMIRHLMRQRAKVFEKRQLTKEAKSQ